MGAAEVRMVTAFHPHIPHFLYNYFLVNGHVSYWNMPPMSQPLVNKSPKPTASKSFTTLYRNDLNGTHLQGNNLNSEPQGWLFL
jgi:hypothetical protein